MSESKTSWEARLDEKVQALEKKMEELGHKLERGAEDLEKRTEKLGRDIEERVQGAGGTKTHRSGAGFFWGLVFIVAGVIWLGNQFGWFDYDVPWAALFLIAGGIYMVVRYWDRSGDEPKDSL